MVSPSPVVSFGFAVCTGCGFPLVCLLFLLLVLVLGLC